MPRAKEALALPASAWVARYLLQALIEAEDSPISSSARARGVSRLRLTWRHLLPLGSGTLWTLLALDLPVLVSGAVVVETVFSWPGIGRLTLEAILGHDVPLVMALVWLQGLMVIVAREAARVMAERVDPRRGRAS